MVTLPHYIVRENLGRSIVDLGDMDPSLKGILSPVYDDHEIRRHIHSVFLENADAFSASTPIDRASINHFKDLFLKWIPNASLFDEDRIILDVGSGSGTTIFPLLELGRGTVIATDLSLPLLIRLRNRYDKSYSANDPDTLAIIQMNAEETIFADNSIDLVCGSNILHHIVSLDSVFSEFYRILKPGGAMLFWEPFENGAQMTAMIFRLIVAENDKKNHNDRLPAEFLSHISMFLDDLQRRKGRWKDVSLLEQLDDKWYFTRSHLSEVLSLSKFKSSEIHNIYDSHNVLVNMVRHEFSRALLDFESLPLWVHETVDVVYRQMSEDFLKENPYSAAIIALK